MSTFSRKLDHIRICLEEKVEGSCRPFDDLSFVHRALPEIDSGSIDTSCSFLGKRLNAPIIICAMTGGHPEAKEININLARAAEEVGVAIGVGSERAALEDPASVDSFSAVRDAAPTIPVIGNIGAVELVREGPRVIDRVAQIIDADAVAVHLNFLQESVQPEGERDASGVLDALRAASAEKMPVIVKETGAGISGKDARDIVDAGVSIIDVSGTGGTSWSAVEGYRGRTAGNAESALMGDLFWSWGIPTPVSVIEASAAGAMVISSGGVRSGLDVSKSIALGAFMAGVALPLLKPATIGWQDVAEVLDSYIRALKISMFLTGCTDLSMLSRAGILITGKTREILELRGYDPRPFAFRREI
jgi:isopentenyl-diphosphate delta-isomerase